MPQIFLFGYFGAGNFGDEWTLASFLKGIRQMNFKGQQVIALSRNPNKTEREHNIKAIARSWKAISSALSKSQVVIGCGGSLLQDVTSFRSLVFYCLLIWLGKFAGKKVALIGQGLGPLRRRVSQILVKKAINACDFVTFREPVSFNLAKEIGCKLENCFVTADLTFAWDELPQCQREKSIAVNLRPVKGNGIVENVFNALKGSIRKDEKVLLLPLQPKLDETSLQPLAQIPSSEWFHYETWSDGLKGVAISHLLLAMRLHALIAACLLGVPFVGLNYDPKVKNIFGEITGRQILPLSADANEIAAAIEQVRLAEGLKERLVEFASTQRNAAMRNFNFLSEKVL